MAEENSNRNLQVLKVIAETLNRSNDLDSMLSEVMKALLDVTGLSTGWIFLVDERPYYRFVTSHNLPPALSWDDRKPMCRGRCFCLNHYWDGELSEPVNIIECKRLEDAVKYGWGETDGITHHATVPLSAGGERFGIMNVAAPGKRHFSDDELTLLQSVAYQIGTAVKRTRLYQAQERRGENFAKLNEVIRSTSGLTHSRELLYTTAKRCAELFDWPLIAFYMIRGEELQVQASNREFNKRPRQVKLGEDFNVTAAYREQNVVKSYSAFRELHALGLPEYQASIAVPIKNGQGVLLAAGHKDNLFSESDVEVLKALSTNVSLALEQIEVHDKREALLLYEERNRLARDLHDSVNQKLFSLSLTSRGMAEIMKKEEPAISEAVSDIQQLSKEALTDMRSMIWQLRPVGIEEGVITALKKYGKSLNLSVNDTVKGVHDLPRKIEETLWRIGQEAFNNISKYAGCPEVDVTLRTDDHGVLFEITDKGEGFDYDAEVHDDIGFGLKTMAERAELAGGTCTIQSRLTCGTTITIFIPWKHKKERGRTNDENQSPSRR